MGSHVVLPLRCVLGECRINVSDRPLRNQHADRRNRWVDMKPIVCFLIVALLVFHQDNWLWDDGRLVFGFLPIGLAYQASLSILAGITWYLATRYCWPEQSGVDESRERPPV